MKIEIKKIAMVIAVGIFAFIEAFGLNEVGDRNQILGAIGDKLFTKIRTMPVFDTIKIINDTKDYTLNFQINEDQPIELASQKAKEINTKEMTFQSVRLTLKKQNETVGEVKVENLQETLTSLSARARIEMRFLALQDIPGISTRLDLGGPSHRDLVIKIQQK